MLMKTQEGGPQPTRIIALGSAALTDGFSLIGVETLADATPAMLEKLLADLWHGGEKALVFIESGLGRSGGPWLSRVRGEGGRIVVVEVPPLDAPQEYRSPVEDVVRALLGPQALEEDPR